MSPSERSYAKLLEASAGTGKTYRLSKEYITLLLKNPNARVQNILAVTFTNKAAGEMRARIFSWLKEAALGKEERLREFENWTGLSPQEVKKKAEEAVEEILRDFSLFRVGTIDSFIRKIALAGAYDLELPPRFDIAASSEPYHDLAMDELLVKNFDEVLEFLKEYIREHEGWNFRKYLYERIKGIYEKERIHGIELGEVPREDLEERFERVKDLSSKLVEVLDGALKKDARRALTEKIYRQDLSSKFLRKKYISELVKNKHTIPPETENLWKEFRRALGEYFYYWGAYQYSSILRIYRHFSHYLEEIKKQENIIFLEELNHIIHQNIEKLNIPEISIKFSEEISHFLFDEFQDTVPVQWENLFFFIDEAFSSRPSSLFIVGDRKQSIYRFRGGDPELMGSLIEKAGENNLEVKILEDELFNRRSKEKILEFVKKTFGRETLYEFLSSLKKGKSQEQVVSPDTRDYLLNVYKRVEETHKIEEGERDSKRGGYVEVKIIEGKDKEEIEENVGKELISLINEIRNRFPPEDIMILVRKRKQARKVAEWLSGEGIPIISQSSMSIKKNPVVSQMVSLMKFLDSPLDDVAFISFILGDVFEKGTGARGQVLGFLNRLPERRESPLYIYFKREFPQLWKDYFEEIFSRAAGFLPPYDLAVKIAETFSVKGNAFLLKFFETLWEREGMGENSLKDFLIYWEKAKEEDLAIEMPDVKKEVRIMTVHKAKGLEAPVVIVPFAELKLEVKETVDLKRGLYIKLNDVMKHFPVSGDAYFMEERLTLLDEVNNLYVAFTRAKEELYVFVPSYRDNLLSKFPFGKIFEDGPWRLGEKLDKGKRETTSPQTFSSSFSLKWKENIREDGLRGEISSHWEEKRRGEAIHRVLEKIGKNMPEREELIRYVKNEGVEEVLGKIEGMLKENPDLFGGDVFTEVEIVDREGKTYRIDRLVVDRDEVRVFEFKTGAKEPQHRDQVKKYVNLVAEAISGKPVRGILLYLLSGEREEIDWEGL